MQNNLRKYRESLQMTQEDLARLTGVSRQSIISIEKGQYVPSTVLALKFASALHTLVEDLFYLEKGD